MSFRKKVPKLHRNQKLFDNIPLDYVEHYRLSYGSAFDLNQLKVPTFSVSISAPHHLYLLFELAANKTRNTVLN